MKRYLAIFTLSLLLILLSADLNRKAQAADIILLPDVSEISTQKSIYFDYQLREDQHELILSVKAKDISVPVFGIAFDLLFDESVLEYKDFMPGNFFEQTKKPIYLVSQSKNDNFRIITGISLRKNDPLPQGSGTIIDFSFNIKAAGTSQLKFENMEIVTLNSKKTSISNVTWQDGMLSFEGILLSGFKNNLFELAGKTEFHLAIEVIFIVFFIIMILERRKLRQRIDRKS